MRDADFVEKCSSIHVGVFFLIEKGMPKGTTDLQCSNETTLNNWKMSSHCVLLSDT